MTVLTNMTSGPTMLKWTLDHDGHYRSLNAVGTSARFEVYPERRPENDNRLTWTIIDSLMIEGVENGHDTFVDVMNTADRLDDEMTRTRNADHGRALDEGITRAKTGRNNNKARGRHDDGLILALAEAGHQWWSIATWLGLSDDYVRLLINQEQIRIATIARKLRTVHS